MKRLFGGRALVAPAALLMVALPLFLGAAGCSFSSGGGSSTSGNGATSSSNHSTSEIQPPTTQPSTTASPTTQPPTTASPTTTALPTTTVSPSTTVTTTSTTLRPGQNYTRVPVPTDEKVVALTFDAAYDPAPLKDILAALEEAGADATFFLTGEFVRDFPAWTKAISAGGYPIGNHSYSHPDFTVLSSAAMRNEVRKMASALIELGGRDPKPLFRAPYGELNTQVLSVLAGEGYVSVLWTIDTLDWKPERTPEQIRNTVLENLSPGVIILMHVGSRQTARILPELLKEIEARGYGFVDLRDAPPGASD